MMQIRRMQERLWDWWNHEQRLREILIALILAQILVLLIPQSPVPHTDTQAYTQWLAEQQPTLGVWTNLLSSLRLFTFHTSLWMRGLIVWAVWLAVIHGVQAWEHKQQGISPWRDAIICSGGLLILIGWGLQFSSGWTVPEVLAWPGHPIELPGHDITLHENNVHTLWWSGPYGVYLLPTGKGQAVQVQARDARQRPLLLQLSTHDTPQETLSIPLTGYASEAYFALPNEGYAFRVYLPAGQTATHIQAYDISSGEWLTETTITHTTTLPLPQLSLQAEQTPLRQYKAVYNPGALWMGLGWLVLIGTVISRHHETDRPLSLSEEL